MILERDIEKALVKYCKSKGYKCFKMTGYVGMPDRLILKPNGVAVFVELKAPNKKPRATQLRMHDELRKLGFPVLTIDNKDDILF